MPNFQARSITQMVLLGFLVVLLPVMAALTYGANSLSALARTHRDHLSAVADIVETSENLAKGLLDLERLARQYQLLAEPALLGVFNSQAGKLLDSLRRLNDTDAGTDVHTNAAHLEELVKELQTGINLGATHKEEVLQALQVLPQLRATMQRLRLATKDDLKAKVDSAKSLAESTQSRLLFLGFIVLPGTLFLVALFSILITRPIKAIDRTIKQIGMGNYHHNEKFTGPRDLVIVAKRLAWLGQRLQDSEASQERFLRHISHELKTPLASIKEGIELLADEIPGPINSRQREVLNILGAGLQHFQKLINNLLDFNLLRNNKTLQKVPVEIGDLVNNLVRLHNLTATRKKIRFEIVGDALPLLIDKSVINAALDNLLSNAVGFSPEGGRITIRWYRRDRGVALLVGDEGPGIAPEEREQVFLPFFQGRATRVGPLKGTGLGLAVARECIISHGGDLQIVEAEKGAWLEIFLPYAAVAKGSALSQEGNSSLGALNSMGGAS